MDNDNYNRQEAEKQGVREHFARDKDFYRGVMFRYALSELDVFEGNAEAFNIACRMLRINPDLKYPEDLSDSEYEKWNGSMETHHFVTFVGECGRGKTHLAMGIGIHFVENEQRLVAYYQVPDLLAQLRESISNNGERYHNIISRCKKCDVLILDDLGMEKPTEWAVEQLDSIIDYRYIRCSDTIFTTNLNPTKMPPRIASRIKEGEICFLKGVDYREVKASQREKSRHIDTEVSNILGGKGK